LFTQILTKSHYDASASFPLKDDEMAWSKTAADASKAAANVAKRSI
jgi:hypothetical protein